jgi:hypothetical protein
VFSIIEVSFVSGIDFYAAALNVPGNVCAVLLECSMLVKRSGLP